MKNIKINDKKTKRIEDWTKRSVEEVTIKGKVAGKGKIDVQIVWTSVSWHIKEKRNTALKETAKGKYIGPRRKKKPITEIIKEKTERRSKKIKINEYLWRTEGQKVAIN